MAEDLEKKYAITLSTPHKKRTESLSYKKKKLYKKRSSIEANISEGKRVAGFDKSYYSRLEGDFTWTGFSVFALNLR